jgi:protein-disulfide isomerase
MTTRRNALTLLAGVAAAGLLPAMPALAQVNPAELAQAGPLGERALGRADAKVTIIEYASLTCSHCSAFHKDTWPELKKRYVDTGKVRYVFREFPLDPLATAGFMLARCDDSEAKYWGMVDILFEQQRTWAYSERPVDALQQLVRQAGFSQEKFESCLRDQKLYDGVNAVKVRGERLGVNSTPTFFINGKMERGNLAIAEIERIIKPLLGE